MQPNTGVSAKSLSLPLRRAAEEFLGRPIEDDEMVAMYTYRVPEPEPQQDHEAWVKKMEDLFMEFPQTPLLSDEAVSRESIYAGEDEHP